MEASESDQDAADDAPRERAAPPAPTSPAPAPQRRSSTWPRPLALAIAAAVLFTTLHRSGIWDPYELDSADLSRRIAVNVFKAQHLALPDAMNEMPTLSDLRMGELPFTSMALGFELFGLHDWSGRLPLAVWGFVGVWALYELLARLSGRHAGVYGAIALVTMPLYFMQARTMLGDIVTMSALSLAFAGLVGALFDGARKTGPDGVEEAAKGTLLVKALWLVPAAIGLVAGYMSRGYLIGVAVPALSAGITWAVLRLGAGRKRPLEATDVIGALALAGGLVAAWAGIALIIRTAPDAPLPRGLAVTLLKKSSADATFDRTIRHLGHALFPWSAFLPFAVGRLFRAPVELASPARDRETGLRVALLVGATVAYAAYAAIAPHAAFIPFSGVALFAGIAALALADFERGAPPSRALALGTILLVFVLYRDMTLDPSRAFSVFEVEKPSFPKGFEPASASAMRTCAALFAGLVGLAWFEAQPSTQPGSLRRWANERVEAYRSAVQEVTRIWNGNLLFALVVLEAALVGLGAMLFLGTRLGWASVAKLPRNFIDLGLNAWWALPLACAFLPAVLVTARDLFRVIISRTGLPRAAGVALGAVVAGAILAFGYYPALAAQLSPKEVFDAYARLERPGEPLGLLGVRARSIAYYHQGGEVTSFSDPASAFSWLTEGQGRRWMIMKADDLPRLNSLHRQRAGKNLPVLDARSSQILLISNDLGGRPNANPLAQTVLDEPPSPARPLDVGFEDQLDLLGWEVTDADGRVVDSVVPQRKYHMRFYFRVLKPISGSWKAFLHIDGFQRRFNGDHAVLDGKYAINLWQPNDVIVDDYVFELEPNFTPGDYTVFFGFFSGDSRFKVSRGQHHENRVIAGALRVR
ncbi:glycosyltransferase family 39 protein [Polyangium aurulentum]|uniref:glycosyltransferase family 39 protein n=1 Tax=Polyangium aurulentum TaxID=2567896 RepID=UPI0010ADA8DF|nr:glycosyltransferase family 39 protein [Polyangium aurulentum]UQA58268.1 glycosyltransferase family 39 protein [Polyangium aurulentum]